MDQPQPAAERYQATQRFTMLMALLAALFAVLPFVIASLLTPAGEVYLGYQFSTDDQMVYAAWMRQAMDGQFLFDNRFTTDAQAGLTVHVYFWLLGQVARVTGIAVAACIARGVFAVLFVFLLRRLLILCNLNTFVIKLAIPITLLAGGIGFMYWQRFGQDIATPVPDVLRWLTMGRLPTDVWQPEGFIMPSLIVNSLFGVSLCLILVVLTAVLEARDGWKPVLVGGLAFAALMNIHSYDVLLIALVLIAFLAATVVSKQAESRWVLRASVIGLAAIPPALWFMHVLRVDPVFQARAATETFSPSFRQVAVGYLPVLVLAMVSMWTPTERLPRRLAGAGLFVLLVLAGFLSSSNEPGYWLTTGQWAVCFVLVVAAVALMARPNPGWNLMAAWACVGLIAPYFPALFQRKLLMGLALPLGVLAAIGLAEVMRKLDRSPRNMLATVCILLLAGTPLQWFFREISLVRDNVSNTTVHPVYLSKDVAEIVQRLDDEPGKKVVLAMPGLPMPVVDQAGNPVPAEFVSPFVPDLNPIASGLTGAYTYAGHWSETPKYLERRSRLETEFFRSTATRESQLSLIEEVGATHVIAPNRDTFAPLELEDFDGLGERIYQGNQFDLIRLPRR